MTTKVKDFTNIKLEMENNIAVVSIHNPPANALSSDTIQGLSECMDYVANESGAKAIILTGEGKFFAAGADIKEFTVAIGDVEKGKSMASSAQAVFNKIENLEIPVIAAVNGACLGGGLELAMSCHLRIAADHALLGQPEVNLGLIPGFGGTQRLTRLIGRGKATELILTGEHINGKQAEEIGLVNYSVLLEELLPKAKELAGKIVEKSKVPVQAALKAINTGLKGDVESGLALEAKLFGELFGTEDMREGVTAFVEKRKANFRDR